MALDVFTSHLGYEQGRIVPKFHESSYDFNGNVIDGTVAELTSDAEPFALSAGAELPIEVDNGPRQTVIFDPTDFVAIATATAAEVATVLARDVGRARLHSEASEPFALVHGDLLVLRVDDGADQTVTIDEADFVDIEAATANEVAAVITASTLGASSRAINGRVLIETDTYGLASSLDVVSGAANAVLMFTTARVTGSAEVIASDETGHVMLRSALVGSLGSLRILDPNLDNANQELGFSLLEVTGTTGAYSFVLGFDTPGHVETLSGGDFVQISQTGEDYNTGEIARIFGAFRIPESPNDYTWRLSATTASFTEEIELPSGVFDTFNLIDFGINVSQLSGVQDLELRLELVGPADPVAIEMPAAYLDVIGFAEFGEADIVLLNRIPHPEQTGVPHPEFPTISLMIVSTNGDAIDDATVQITIEGVSAYSGSAFQTGFSGTVSLGIGPSGDDARYVIDTSLQTYASSQTIDVRVRADTVGSSASIDETYTFTIADTIEPEVVAASARSKTIVRITFSEDVDDSALIASNYTFERLSTPAVEFTAIAVERISETTVDVEISTSMTFNASYRVTVESVADLAGNIVIAPNNTAVFVGYACPVPEGRDFNLYQMMADLDRRADALGHLQLYLGVLQESLDQVLCLLDDWTNILDPDLAPDEFIDAMLASLGNPWRFDLSANDRRRLLAVLVAMYQAKGTTFGIIDAIFFFMGIDVEIVPLNQTEDAWILGDSELGEDTLLGPSDPAILYTFEIHVPITLTDAQRSQMIAIATYMRPAHEHIRLVEPDGDVTVSIFWELGDSELGNDTILSAAS